MKYSIIIPVYNSEKTLRRCIESVLNQKYSDFQMILVDDGSSDNSLAICKKYAEINFNVCVFSKENGGVSSARNVGLQNADGEYVLFLDSDDYVCDNYFEKLNSYGLEDLISFKRITFTGTKKKYQSDIPKTLINEKNIVDKINWLYFSRRLNALYTLRFKNSIIKKHNISFLCGLQIGEDILFSLTYALYCESVTFRNDNLYYYDISNTCSLSRRYREDLIEMSVKEFSAQKNEILKSKFPMEKKRELLSTWDYWYNRRVFTCIGEELKNSNQSYFMIRRKIYKICEIICLNTNNQVEYKNNIHRIIKICVRQKFVTVLYLIVLGIKH